MENTNILVAMGAYLYLRIKEDIFRKKRLTMKKRIKYFVNVIIMLTLCRIHDYTKYKQCRTLSDLFYWPEGPCIDMLIVISVLFLGILLLYDYHIVMKKARMRKK